LYIPQLDITVSTSRTSTGPSTGAPVSGLTPSLARVAAITARSRVVTLTEHWVK
jgi:hypothetical protein